MSEYDKAVEGWFQIWVFLGLGVNAIGFLVWLGGRASLANFWPIK